MERALSPSTGNKELIDNLVDSTEQKALEEAGKSKARVSQVEDLQKGKVRDLLGGGDDDVTKDIITSAESEIDKQQSERMESIGDTKDAYVLERTGSVAGVQHDDTREVGIAHDVLMDPSTAERVSKHEAQHREQEAGSQSFTYENEHGETVEVRRLDMRENDSIQAEGGLSNHTPEYHDYVAHTQDVASLLDTAGENGSVMTKEAALTTAGFEKVRQKLIEDSIRKRLEKELGMAA